MAAVSKAVQMVNLWEKTELWVKEHLLGLEKLELYS